MVYIYIYIYMRKETQADPRLTTLLVSIEAALSTHGTTFSSRSVLNIRTTTSHIYLSIYLSICLSIYLSIDR